MECVDLAWKNNTKKEKKINLKSVMEFPYELSPLHCPTNAPLFFAIPRIS